MCINLFFWFFFCCVHVCKCVCVYLPCLLYHLMARVVVCPHLSPPSPPSAVSPLFCWQTPHLLLLHPSFPPAFPFFLSFSLQCQFPPLFLALCQALRHVGGRGCPTYANDPTLCKSVLLLIKSQLQIQLADWTEREEVRLLGSVWCEFDRKIYENIVWVRILKKQRNHCWGLSGGRG